jgi:beta-carotene ketolase (CrtO type)
VSRYDAVVIGAGHNGLVCAAYLARAGRRVCVLEKASVLGGCATTESLLPSHPEYRFNRGAIDLINIQGTPILDDLSLASHGLKLIHHDPLWYFPFPDGTAISFYRDIDRTCASIAEISPEDAEAYRRFNAMWDGILTLMAPFDYGPAPSLAQLGTMAGAAGTEADALLWVLMSSPRDLIRSFFTTPHMQGIMAWMGVQAGTPPEQPAAALALTLMTVSHHNGMARAEGGMGALSAALKRFIEAHGGEVRVDAEVTEIVLTGMGTSVRGAAAGGEVFEAPIVVSAIDARRVFDHLIRQPVLVESLQRRVTNSHADYPSLFKVDVALSGRPSIEAPGGEEGLVASINMANSYDHVATAFNDYARGVVAPDPPLMCAVPSVLDPTLAPDGGHTLWLSQWTPARLWHTASAPEREACADRMVEIFARYAPNTADLIVDRAVTTPADRQAVTGNLNGNPFQLDMSLDQSMRFRPVPGLAQYETPVGGLYLTGSGTHPGGGVTGVPGYNTAHVILRRAGRTRRRQRAGVERTAHQLRQAASMYRAWRELRKVV